jgi:hypothetical protein
MGRLPRMPLEVQLAAMLFLLMLGVADFFGGWQVRNFAAFTPAGIAATVEPSHFAPAGAVDSGETPIDPASLDRRQHRIGRELLVQDTHVHVPVYAMTAAFLCLIVFGLRLSSRARTILVLGSFAAPLFDFAGLWGAHLFPQFGKAFGWIVLSGGFSMGIVYTSVLVLTLWQCGPGRFRKETVS